VDSETLELKGNMKIAILIKRFIQTGGAERIAVELSRSLLKKGHEVHVYSQEFDEDACKGIVFHPIKHRIRKPIHLNSWDFAIQTARLLKREQYDVVQSFERVLRSDIFYVTCICYRNWIWRGQSQTKKIINYMKVAIDPRHMSYLILESLQFRREICNKKVIATSKLIKEDIIANYRVIPREIEVVYPGVESKTFQPGLRDSYRKEVRDAYGIGDDVVVILFVGSEFKRKGLRFLIEGVARLIHELKGEKEMRCLVVGGGPSAEYQAQAKALGISDLVTFVGLSSEVEKYFAASDVFVLPSRNEPSSLAVLEAMACELPVVIAEESGIAELVKDGFDALLLSDPTSAQEIKEKLLLVMNDDKRESLGMNGRKNVVEHSWENACDQMLRIYDST